MICIPLFESYIYTYNSPLSYSKLGSYCCSINYECRHEAPKTTHVESSDSTSQADASDSSDSTLKTVASNSNDSTPKTTSTYSSD